MDAETRFIAGEILGDVPANRVRDLDARQRAGTLTAAEQLALAVLTGGRTGEECVPGFLDACMAEYSHGSYRVPVRVVADIKRCLIVAHCPAGTTEFQADQMRQALNLIIRDIGRGDPAGVITVASGWKLEVYEVATPAEAGVVVRAKTDE